MERMLPKYLFHKSSFRNRTSILKDGLKPMVGGSYYCHWGCKKGLIPLIFLYDRSILEYDSTYDDDIYRIDTDTLDKRRLTTDPDEDMKGCYAYGIIIPISSIDIVYKGTGKDA